MSEQTMMWECHACDYPSCYTDDEVVALTGGCPYCFAGCDWQRVKDELEDESND